MALNSYHSLSWYYYPVKADIRNGTLILEKEIMTGIIHRLHSIHYLGDKESAEVGFLKKIYSLIQSQYKNFPWLQKILILALCNEI